MRLVRDTLTLGYDVVGHGPALLFLHAFPYDRRMWAETAARLAASRRVVTLDARGFGESTLPGPYALTDLADDAAALLDHLGVAMAHVAGLSMGGYTALALAARHPARLASLALCDTRAAADSDEARRGREAGLLAARSDLNGYLDGFPQKLLSPGTDAALQKNVRALGQAGIEAVAAALVAMRDRPDRRAELPSLRCPTLVLVGAEDRVTPPAEARALAAAIPAARYLELAGAGHLANLEAPAPFAAALETFLDEA